MKKLIFVLVFASLLALTNNVSAWDAGCTASGPYSVTTGKLCGTPPEDCFPGDVYSFKTGKLCAPVVVEETPTPTEETEAPTGGSVVVAPAPSPINYEVAVNAGPTYADQEINIDGVWVKQLDGVLVQVRDYYSTDSVTIKLKDGANIIPEKSRETYIPSDRNSFKGSINSYYSLPLENKVYTVEVSVRENVKTGEIVVTSDYTDKHKDYLGNAKLYPFSFLLTR